MATHSLLSRLCHSPILRCAPVMLVALLALSAKAADRADEYLASCKEKFRNGDRKGAIADCTKALRANPSAEAYYERGRAYVALAVTSRSSDASRYAKNPGERAKLYSAALDDYGKAISLNSSYSEAYLARGYLRRNEFKDLDGALQDLTQGIDLLGTGWRGFWATKSQVLEFRAEVRKDKGDIEGAISDYGAAITAHQGKDLDLLYAKRAAVRKAKGDLDGAISDLTYASVGSDPSSDRGGTYIRDLADLKKAKGDFDGAIGDLTRAIRLVSAPSDYCSRGELRKTKGDLAGAIADFSFALLVDPCYADAWTSRARAREANGDVLGAQADTTQAKQLTRGETGLGGLFGSACERAFTFQAPAFFDGTTIFMPNGTIAPRNIPAAQTFLRNKEQEFASAGQSDADKRNYGSAAYHYTEAIKLGLDDPTLYSRRSYVRQAMGDVDGAIGDLSEAIRLSESRKLTMTVLGASVSLAAALYDMRGGAKAKVGDTDGAIEDFTKAIELQPNDTGAYDQRSNAKRSKGNLRGADEDLAAAGHLKAGNTDKANVPTAASAAFVPLPTDMDCSIQGLDVYEGPNGWVAKSAAGLSCTMRGLAGTKDVVFVSKTLTNGTASAKDFGEIRFIVHGVPRGGGPLPNGGSVVEVDYPLSPPEPGLVTITLGADRVSALRDYLSAPTPFEASVASCSGRVATAWPPDVRLKKPESIWRIVDLADCSVYYAKLIDLGVHGRAGMMMTFDGTVTLTPDPGHQRAAHVTAIDPWKPPFTIPGAKSDLHGEATGMRALLGNPDGTVRQEQPEIQGGQGYENVSFEDLRSKKKLSFPKFIADTVRSDEATAPPLKE